MARKLGPRPTSPLQLLANGAVWFLAPGGQWGCAYCNAGGWFWVDLPDGTTVNPAQRHSPDCWRKEF